MKTKIPTFVKLQRNFHIYPRLFRGQVGRSVAIAICALSVWLAVSPVHAQKRVIRTPAARSDTSTSPTLTWDLGGSAGSYNGVSYSEANLGLNWFLSDGLVWRNSVFARFPSAGDGVQGLDTSLRLQHAVTSDDGSFGLGFFGGPGYRFTKAESAALFGEAGLTVKLGGLKIGGGVRAFRYANPGKALNGTTLPADDVTYFVILSGGGAL